MQIHSPDPDPTTETIQTDTIDVVAFFIPGTPVPQGSKTAFVVGGRAVVTDQNRSTLKPWRATVATYASEQARTFNSPVAVTLRFTMPRPQKPRWHVPAVKPDIDKLVRAMLDGLTEGGLIADDARVVDLHATEIYGDQLGAHVIVKAV